MEMRHKFLSQECTTTVERKNLNKVCYPIAPAFPHSRPMRGIRFPQTPFFSPLTQLSVNSFIQASRLTSNTKSLRKFFLIDLAPTAVHCHHSHWVFPLLPVLTCRGFRGSRVSAVARWRTFPLHTMWLCHQCLPEF